MNFWFEWIIKSPVQKQPDGGGTGTTIVQQVGAEPFYALVLVVLVIFFSMMLVKRYRQIRPMHADQKQYQDYGIPLTQSIRSAESSGRLDEAPPIDKEELLAQVDSQHEVLNELDKETRVRVEKDLDKMEENEADDIAEGIVVEHPKIEPSTEEETEQFLHDARHKKWKVEETDNKQHTYDTTKKIDKRKTPEFRARFLENMRKAREKKKLEKKHGKAKGVRPKGTGKEVRESQ